MHLRHLDTRCVTVYTYKYICIYRTAKIELATAMNTVDRCTFRCCLLYLSWYSCLIEMRVTDHREDYGDVGTRGYTDVVQKNQAKPHALYNRSCQRKIRER